MIKDEAVITIYKDDELIGFAIRNGQVKLYTCQVAKWDDVKRLLVNGEEIVKEISHAQ